MQLLTPTMIPVPVERFATSLNRKASNNIVPPLFHPFV